MRDDFCVFILSHGRHDRVKTYKSLQKAGYTGRVYIVIDDEDKTAEQYREKFGDKVLQFCKLEVAARIDEGDNFNDRRAIIYARNACWDLAKQVGCKYFMQLDDDYANFEYRFPTSGLKGYRAIRKTFDAMLECMIEFFLKTPCLSIAMAQGGDYIGGMIGETRNRLRRKCMNTFVCSVDRPFQFFGRVNEDVNTYTNLGRMGRLFFTVMPVKILQLQTQTNKGGMCEMYLDSGTYLKSFYSVLYSPSCVKVGQMGDPRGNMVRIHHRVKWNHCAACILSEEWRKPRG